jgi:uncharacterized protein
MKTPGFIIDHNAGKLVKWLRMLGCDTFFFTGNDDSDMVAIALSEGRVILTRDTGIIKRRLIASGSVKALLLTSDNPGFQIQEVLRIFPIDSSGLLFTRCLECNTLLSKIEKEEVKDRVPLYVYKTQETYMECLSCRRIYWKGTHWQAMKDKIIRFTDGGE